MTVIGKRRLILTILCVVSLATVGLAGPPDISDSAIEEFFATRFQYDFTRIVDEASLRDFIDVLDHRFAVSEYRQRKELVAEPGSDDFRKPYAHDLNEYSRKLLKDRFLVKKLTEWKADTSDHINFHFIDWFLDRHADLTMSMPAVSEARQLAQRIADRLYKFHFKVDGQKYSATEAADIMFSGDSLPLARRLYRLINDSASVLVPDAAKLYWMHNAMGQSRGYSTTLDYRLDRLSFDKSEWLAIADNFKAITRDEYFTWLDSLKRAQGRETIPLFEIENLLTRAAVLPDSFFTPETVAAAMTDLINGAGLVRIKDALRVRMNDSAAYLALAIRLCPPYDNLLLDSRLGGFAYYRRLAAELGRSLPWVYADSTLPYILREYPPGSDETFTKLFETAALKPEFLAEHLSIPFEMLERFDRNRRLLTAFRIRKSLFYFYFDYILSQQIASDPAGLYMALQDSLFGVRDSSYQWVEIVVTGGLESAAEEVANTFTWAKTIEMLHRRFGDDYLGIPEAGTFLVEKFCRPGRSQTIETYIQAHAADRLSVDYFKRVMRFR